MAHVIKRDGQVQKFDASKIRRWVSWAISSVEERGRAKEAESYILQTTLERLPSRVTTEELHQTVISVCLDKEEVYYSRIAAVLEKATVFKNLERHGLLSPQTETFEEIADFLEDKGLWEGILDSSTCVEELDEANEVYYELEAAQLEYWTLKQSSEKYAKKIKGEAVETPAMLALGIAIGLHGWTQLAYDVARDICYYKLNLPTPVLNGIRDGNTDSISCCVIESGDTTDSIEVASYLASRMTAKKAGIGIFLDTRSKNDPVKNGSIDHLGKAPLYSAVEKEVKKFTQLTRGGSATMSYRCIDPDVQKISTWKSQRVDIAQRIDKIDYEFLYNDAFVNALLNNGDWYLFSKYWAPEVHENFHSPDYMSYVKKAIKEGVPYTKIPAVEVLRAFISTRWETGRVYCHNVTRSNEHTPFLDTIKQSNLCMEIMLPTKPFEDIHDLVSNDPQGEMAFCALAAINADAVSLGEYFSVAERAVRTVDRMIELAEGLSDGVQKQLHERRSIGIGITNLAKFLYNKGLDYDGSYESLVECEQLAATHYYSLVLASQKLAKEGGKAAEGVDFDWLPIDTANFVTDQKDWDLEYDWEALRGVPRKNSVLVAHMPCESSSLFSNSSNGIYPSRARVVYKTARTGRLQFINDSFTEDKLRSWDVNMIPYYQAIQNFTDQAISADYYTDFTKYPDKKIFEIEAFEWFIRQAKAGIKTSYYQNFRDTDASKNDQNRLLIEDSGNECCTV